MPSQRWKPEAGSFEIFLFGSLCLALSACGSGSEVSEPPAASPVVDSGAVVEAVAPARAALRAGLEPGDVVVGWRRESGTGAPAGGAIEGPLGLREVEIEQADRGAVRLEVLRGNERREHLLSSSEWGLQARPALRASVLARYRAVLDDAEAGDRFAELAEELTEEAPAAAAWLHIQAGQELAASPDWERAEMEFAAARELLDEAEEPLSTAAVFELEAEALSERLPPRVERALWEKALALRRIRAPESLAVARDQVSLGRVEITRGGDRARGAALLEESLALRRRLAPGSAAVAESLRTLGILAAIGGGLDRAEECFLEALALLDALEPDVPRTGAGSILANLGVAARRRGRLAEAEAYLERAFDIHQALSPDGPGTAATLVNLGVVARRRGRLAEAEAYWTRALEIRRRHEPESLGVARVIGNLANLANQRGAWVEAEGLHRRNLELFRRLAPDSEDLVVTLSLFADVLAERDRANEARPLLIEALEIVDRRSPDAPIAASLRRQLGVLELAAGRPAEAELLLDEACDRLARVAPGGLDESACVLERGRALLAGGRLDEARRDLAKSVSIRERLSPGTFLEAEALTELAALAELRDDDTEARELLARAVSAIEAHRTVLGGDDPARARFSELVAPIYRRLAIAQLAAGDAAGAFGTLERYRARGLLDLLADRDLLLDDELPRELAAEHESLRLATVRTRDALERAAQAGDLGRITALTAELSSLEEARRQLAKAVRDASPRLAAFRYPEPLGAEEAAGTLPAGSLLLSYVTDEKRSGLVALRSGALGDGALRGHLLPIGRAELAEQIETLRSLLQSRAPTEVTRRAVVQRARRLHGDLLGPVEDLLAGTEELIVLPDGPLHGLPFAVLRDGAGRLLLERVAVSRAPSATARATLADPSVLPEGPVVALVDPATPIAELPPLPASRLEGEVVASSFEAPTVLAGQKATEHRVKEQAGARILHLASHAVFDARFPLDSALLLTPGSGEDGWLRAWEVFEELRLPGTLVVLSACDSGLGANLGGEGMIGLTRSFHYAGASVVVASLWRVSDRSTAALMERFYEAIERGERPAEALRSAQLALLRGPVAVPAPSGPLARLLGRISRQQLDATAPFHWAAFQVFGG